MLTGAAAVPTETPAPQRAGGLVGFWIQADMLGAGGNPAKPTRTTRPDYATRTSAPGGVYVNYLGQEADEGAERVKAAYGADKYERLVELKNKYDPTNLFRLNQNISPTGG